MQPLGHQPRFISRACGFDPSLSSILLHPAAQTLWNAVHQLWIARSRTKIEASLALRGMLLLYSRYHVPVLVEVTRVLPRQRHNTIIATVKTTRPQLVGVDGSHYQAEWGSHHSLGRHCNVLRSWILFPRVSQVKI